MKNTRATLRYSASLLLLSTCTSFAQSRDAGDVATLYRDSVAVEGARYHIATFDADLKASRGTKFDYNWENCQIAARLFEVQNVVRTRYWCEKGFYRE